MERETDQTFVKRVSSSETSHRMKMPTTATVPVKTVRAVRGARVLCRENERNGRTSVHCTVDLASQCAERPAHARTRSRLTLIYWTNTPLRMDKRALAD